MIGSGKFFSSGHDLKSAALFGTFTTAEMNDNIQSQAGNMVKTLINFSKPIIVACNGPAFGIAATMLALCDIVYCSDTAFFRTPFMELGFCAEGVYRTFFVFRFLIFLISIRLLEPPLSSNHGSQQI